VLFYFSLLFYYKSKRTALVLSPCRQWWVYRSRRRKQLNLLHTIWPKFTECNFGVVLAKSRTTDDFRNVRRDCNEFGTSSFQAHSSIWGIPSSKVALLTNLRLQIDLFLCLETLKLKVIRSFETSAETYTTKQLHIPEDRSFSCWTSWPFCVTVGDRK
jgi:hypothetical protein